MSVMQSARSITFHSESTVLRITPKLTKLHCWVVAIQAQVIQRETVGSWVKFTANVETIYKQNQEKIRRDEEIFWVPAADLQCNCPRLRLHQTYLIVGRDERSKETRSGLVLDSRTTVIPWREEFQQRLRKFMWREKQQKC